MPYPTTTFTTIDQLIAYINTYIVTNGMGLIEGVEHNNVENGLADFIIYAPFNSQLVEIVTTTGSKQVTHGITYFMNQTPSNVVFGDNFWNEWAFINATSSIIPFSAGLGYFDLSGIFQTAIPASSLIKISKATNGLWVQTGSFGNAPSVSIDWIKFNTVVGFPSLAVGDYAVTPNDGDTVVVIMAQVQPKSELMFYDGQEVKLNPNGSFNYSVIYGADRTTYTFSQGFALGLAWDFQATQKIN